MTRARRATIANFVEQAYLALDQVDYYRVLGVVSSCTTDDVRTAYYKLAAKLHPDLHGLDSPSDFRTKLTTVFSRIVEAYKVLSDDKRRADYDVALARGNLRLRSGASTRPPPVEQGIQNPSAKRFFQLGLAALNDNSPKSAITNFKLALKLEPDCKVILDKIAEAEQLLS